MRACFAPVSVRWSALVFAAALALILTPAPGPFADTLPLWRLQLLSASPPEQKMARTPGGAAQVQQKSRNESQLIYSPWIKICEKPSGATTQQVCFIRKDGLGESGMPVVAALLIEPVGENRRILRVTLPLGMQLASGTRIVVDQRQPINAPYIICTGVGCSADYEASDELIDKLKHGQGLVVEGINSQGQAVSVALPLADFGKAYDGPPTDPNLVAEQALKLVEQLGKHPDDERVGSPNARSRSEF